MVPHSSSSTNGGQAFPFFCGFWATYRRLVLVPNPQVLLQGAQSVHCDTSQSTEYKFCIESKFISTLAHCIVTVTLYSFFELSNFFNGRIYMCKVFLKKIIDKIRTHHCRKCQQQSLLCDHSVFVPSSSPISLLLFLPLVASSCWIWPVYLLHFSSALEY